MIDIHTTYSRYLAGDPSCLDDLLDAARRIALSTARRLGCADPEAVAQEATVKVWRSLRSYDPARAAMTTWIASIVRRCAADQHRAAPPVAEELDEAMLTDPASIDYMTLDVSHLTEVERRTLAVFALDPDFDSAAQTLNTSVAGLKKRLQRIAAKNSAEAVQISAFTNV